MICAECGRIIPIVTIVWDEDGPFIPQICHDCAIRLATQEEMQ